MKLFNKYILIGLLVSGAATGCKDFEELEKNPNRPTTAPPSLILNGTLFDLNDRPWSLEHRQNQYWCCNYNYYGTNEYWASATLNFMTLKNIQKMEEEAKRTGAAEVNPYRQISTSVLLCSHDTTGRRCSDVASIAGFEN